MPAGMRTLLGITFLLCLVAEVFSLDCYSCHSFNKNCTLNMTSCNVTTHDTCRSLTVREIGHAHDHEFIINGCGDCVGLISFNSGPYSGFIHSICCSSDLCNDEVSPEKEDWMLNGLVCEGCFALTEAGCNKSMATVQCRGQQDYCMHTSGILHWLDTSTYVFKGCASHTVCQNPNALPVFGIEPTTALYCCTDHLCNLESRNFTWVTTPHPTTPPAITDQATGDWGAALAYPCLLAALGGIFL
ncbi:phospholipase A2 inhibitor gamma subunit B-like [Narcine bancroftii]|uniref:phospholipase A2 inhibitor gamma subunit B-like n=1 Tax=Narcine bancroftii TaxID=1343680 RepID=UPI0038323010